MKKNFLIFVLFLMVQGINAQEINALRIGSVDMSDLKPGDLVRVPVYFDEITQAISLFQIYITFDHTVLEFVSTTNISDSFEDGWRDNITDSFFAAVFIDMKRSGKSSEQKGKLCELEFKYKGGETELLWGTETILEENVRVAGETKLVGVDKSDLSLKLVNGCICSSD